MTRLPPRPTFTVLFWALSGVRAALHGRIPERASTIEHYQKHLTSLRETARAEGFKSVADGAQDLLTKLAHG